jgi:prepilin-type N-terminal cleavage/methylation domain-containing protein
VKRPRVGTDAGFTLVELLIVIVLESIIVGAIGSAFILLLNNSTTVKENLSRTGDARIAAQYIVNDAGNSSGPETSLSDTTSCPDPNPPVAGTASAVVRFDWSTTSSTGVVAPDIVNYVLVSNTLLRRMCVNGTLTYDTAVATNVASASVACAPTADCSGQPTSITATIVETQGSSAGAAFQYSVTGAFQKALAMGAPMTPQNPKALIALGTGTACGSGATGLSLTASSSLRVYGATFVDNANSMCKAMSMTSNATYQAGNTSILTGGSCIATTGSVCPTTASYSPSITDPYGSLAAPTTSGRPSKSGCSGGVAQPGVYASALSISSGTCTMATGVYILQNGLTLSGTSTLTSGSGGVFVYISGGTLSVASTASIMLSATTTGTYANLTVWQAAADTNTISFAGTGQLSITGALYAPKAQVSFTANPQNPDVSVLVAQNVYMANGSIVVGTPSAQALSIAGGSAPSAWTVNRVYPTTTLTAAGGDGNYIWSATNLPPGITLDPATGIASGTPTTVGTYNTGLALDDLLGDDTYTAQFTITINPAPTISTASPLPAGEKTLAYSTNLAATGGTAPFTWTATGLPGGLTINASTGTISGTPTAVGTSAASVTLTDAAGATSTKSLSITIGAAPAISSVTLTNGGTTAGKLEKGDKITVVYSAQMKVSSFCSTWSGDTTNQTLNANNDVTVSVSNGTTDALTATSATCTFNLGSINLGSNAYVTAATTFGGTGANVSTIAWTASTHTLVITLGALKTGTVGTVSSSTPIYTASGSLVDSAGAGISNSPFTLAAGKQF